MSTEPDPMEQLYNRALDSSVTDRAVDFLFRARLLLRITDHDVKAAGDVVRQPAGHLAAQREFVELDDAERVEMGRDVGSHWSSVLKDAIGRLWHTCAVLEIDPQSLNVDNVALTAATLLSARASHQPVDGEPEAA